MPLPQSHDEYIASGYRRGSTARCRGCNAEIVWYLTPNNNKLPVDKDGKNNHWTTCPQRTQFKKAKGAS